MLCDETVMCGEEIKTINIPVLVNTLHLSSFNKTKTINISHLANTSIKSQLKFQTHLTLAQERGKQLRIGART